MPTAVRGTCESAGYPSFVEEKTVQQGPTSMDIMIMAGAVSPTCHCHSHEEIMCDATGDGLYDEHILEIQRFCPMDLTSALGNQTECPYKCFQPFEVLHLHYLECSLRPKHDLYRLIEDGGRCHLAAKPPYGAECEVVDPTGGGGSAGGNGGSMCTRPVRIPRRMAEQWNARRCT